MISAAKRIPMHKLKQMLAEGKSQNQCARELGFSKQAVSKALQKERQMQEGLVSPSAIPAKFDPDGLGAFRRILHTTLTEIKILNSDIKTAAGDDRSKLNIERLKYIAEARKQFALALDIDEKRFSIEEAAKFKEFVLKTIGDLDEATRERIITGLRRAGSLRRLLDAS